jgi:hypothetical protein
MANVLRVKHAAFLALPGSRSTSLLSFILGRVLKSGKYPSSSLPADAYDAVVVGAGPSGSTLGFFASKNGAKVGVCLFSPAQLDVISKVLVPQPIDRTVGQGDISPGQVLR